MTTYPCAGKQDIFFPEEVTTASYDEAKAICQTCDFKDACLEKALINNEGHGVWGGLNPRERRILRAEIGYDNSPLFYNPRRKAPASRDTDPAFMDAYV